MYELCKFLNSQCIDRIAFYVDMESCKKSGELIGNLRVKFINNGKTWDYFQVPYTTYQEFVGAHSAGSYYHKFIKGIFRSEIVDSFGESPLSEKSKVNNLLKFFLLESEKENSKSFNDKFDEGDFLVKDSRGFGNHVIKKDKILEFINQSKNREMKIYQIGKCIIDW